MHRRRADERRTDRRASGCRRSSHHRSRGSTSFDPSPTVIKRLAQSRIVTATPAVWDVHYYIFSRAGNIRDTFPLHPVTLPSALPEVRVRKLGPKVHVTATSPTLVLALVLAIVVPACLIRAQEPENSDASGVGSTRHRWWPPFDLAVGPGIKWQMPLD